MVQWITRCRKVLKSVDRAVHRSVHLDLRFPVVIFSSASLKSKVKVS